MAAAITTDGSVYQTRGRSRAVRKALDTAARAFMIVCAVLTILTTFAIIAVLLEETRRFFTMPDVSLGEFFLTTTWQPLLGSEKHFGIWPLMCGTMLVTAVAAALSLPLGLITAIYLSEYSPRRVRAVLKPVLEVLAGVPTVVYGYFALTVLTPSLQWLERVALAPMVYPLLGKLRDLLGSNGVTSWAVDPQTVVGGLLYGLLDPDKRIDSYNALSAGLAVGIMTLPIVCSLSEDALQAVPRNLREGAYALGGTKFDVSTRVVLPAALSGVVASYILAIARATGETMIVALAAGGLSQMTIDPRDQVQTMTGYMVQIFLGDTATGGVEYYSSYAVAAMLFLMTFALTVIGNRVLAAFREVYH
jgi:phosphate transport system permease protein